MDRLMFKWYYPVAPFLCFLSFCAFIGVLWLIWFVIGLKQSARVPNKNSSRKQSSPSVLESETRRGSGLVMSQYQSSDVVQREVVADGDCVRSRTLLEEHSPTDTLCPPFSTDIN